MYGLVLIRSSINLKLYSISKVPKASPMNIGHMST
ncbi:MAG: hypothetical protein RLZZ177_2806, partial [Pseudomonadota bacterium]